MKNTASPEQASGALEVLAGSFSLDNPEFIQRGYLPALSAVLGNSNFLARWAKRHPEKVIEILQGDLQQRLTREKILGEIREGLHKNHAVGEKELGDLLLGIKYNQLFRITLRDVGLKKPLPEIAAELSDLAGAIAETALRWQEENLRREFGAPRPIPASAKQIPFTVMAMGKLGGNELNFSSDIDVLYLFGSSEGILELDGKKMEKIPREYFVKLSERLSRFLGRKHPEGFLYRVDVDLRPEGKAGVLANSLEALEDYYEYRGADWERQALIKAAWAAGDRALFEEFQDKIRPFVYPKSSDFSILKSLRVMKEKIVESISHFPKDQFHLKLGDGGIREIEFFVQSLQLLFGGNLPTLQTPNTLQALDRLFEEDLIHREEYQGLSEAYRFLRTMEHRLQLVEEQQTHQMPTSPEELQMLARRMGYVEENPEEACFQMQQDLDRHRSYVKNIFTDLLSHRFEES